MFSPKFLDVSVFSFGVPTSLYKGVHVLQSVSLWPYGSSGSTICYSGLEQRYSWDPDPQMFLVTVELNSQQTGRVRGLALEMSGIRQQGPEERCIYSIWCLFLVSSYVQVAHLLCIVLLARNLAEAERVGPKSSPAWYVGIPRSQALSLQVLTVLRSSQVCQTPNEMERRNHKKSILIKLWNAGLSKPRPCFVCLRLIGL